jgi:hypothetical protein
VEDALRGSSRKSNEKCSGKREKEEHKILVRTTKDRKTNQPVPMDGYSCPGSIVEEEGV